MLSEDEQLEIWWQSLSPDQQESVLALDPEADPPGWIVASIVAANVQLDESPATDAAEDLKSHVPQTVQEFVARKRAEA